MEQVTEFIHLILDSSSVWVIFAVVFVGLFLFLWLIKHITFFYLRRLSNKSRFSLDTIILDSVSRPVTLIIVAASLSLSELVLIKIAEDVSSLETTFTVVSKLAIVFAIIIFTDQFSRKSLNRYSNSSPMLRSSGNLVKGTVRVVIYLIGVLIVLSNIGISITPIVASLGIGSLAVALALQPTLENFFSGIQMLADKPIRVGDFIELDSGEQGFVDKIGWRSTWIKMLPNNTVIMPNSVLAQSKIINYYYPEKQLSVPVDVGVHYDSDLEHVERVSLEVAREILKTHKWGIKDYDTFVVFHTFDNSSINFTVMLRAQEYFNRFFIKSEFIKALHKRFAEEGIVIPYPIQAINLTQEGSASAFSAKDVEK
ncbi:MAG: mechanosensitive ion channel family protein [Aliiglaciecola sp.]|uniref:mechanosensitive ion channel family protein n=1 Tax=Aliiglaciecola sp. TaxID=1872441 RepID=UPI003297E578